MIDSLAANEILSWKSFSLYFKSIDSSSSNIDKKYDADLSFVGGGDQYLSFLKVFSIFYLLWHFTGMYTDIFHLLYCKFHESFSLKSCGVFFALKIFLFFFFFFLYPFYLIIIFQFFLHLLRHRYFILFFWTNKYVSYCSYFASASWFFFLGDCLKFIFWTV